MMTTNRSPADIEDEIRRTRADVSASIDELSNRFSPGQLLDQTLRYVRDEGGEVGHNVARRVKSNPLPLAMMAASLAWLMVSDSRRPRPEREVNDWDERELPPPEYVAARAYSPAGGVSSVNEQSTAWPTDPMLSGEFGSHSYADIPYDDESIAQHEQVHAAYVSVEPTPGETAESYRERQSDARATALGIKREAEEETSAFRSRVDRAYEELSERARRARHRVKDDASRLRDRARQSARQARSAAGHQADRARSAAVHARDVVEERAYRARQQAGEFYTDNPLVVGAIGVAAGALLGSLLPSSRVEDRWVGSAGDSVRHGAEKYAYSAMDAAAKAADNVATKTREAAEREGLTPSEAKAAGKEFGERIRRVGDEAIGSVEEEASKLGAANRQRSTSSNA
jgi:ElaB/YqjD/DUF883 family membrane-anchored ribosome-binding protein